jgi:hypothetical protein
MPVGLLLLAGFGFPVLIGIAIVALVWGLFSIPTAVLSLLLVGTLIGGSPDTLLRIYILASFFIIGYQIHRAILRRRLGLID